MIASYVDTNKTSPDTELIRIGDTFKVYNNFRFSSVAGTYIQGACEDQHLGYCPDNDESTLYYRPNSGGGAVIRVTAGILTKLEQNNYKILKKLGIPVNHAKSASDNGFRTSGIFQDFIAGRLYTITKKENETLNLNDRKTYSLEKDLQVYYDNNGGSGGRFGFPQSDTFDYETGFAQNFEGTRIEKISGEVVHTPIWYKTDGDHHFLIVDLDPNLEKRACFKHYMHMEEGVEIGDKDETNNLMKKFAHDSFKNILASSTPSILNNRKLNGFEPVAAINGDYFDDDPDSSTFGPLSINFSIGHDYSGDRRWTSVAISRENEVVFTTKDPNEIEMKYKYNIVGGGPKLMTNGIPRTNGQEGEETCESLMGKGKWWIPYIDNPCDFHAQRTVIGLTNMNYMIILVTGGYYGYKGLDFYDIDDKMNIFNNVYGEIREVNMLDSGGSSSLMYEGEIKQKNKELMPLLMMYSGVACEQ